MGNTTGNNSLGGNSHIQKEEIRLTDLQIRQSREEAWKLRQYLLNEEESSPPKTTESIMTFEVMFSVPVNKTLVRNPQYTRRLSESDENVERIAGKEFKAIITHDTKTNITQVSVKSELDKIKYSHADTPLTPTDKKLLENEYKNTFMEVLRSKMESSSKMGISVNAPKKEGEHPDVTQIRLKAMSEAVKELNQEYQNRDLNKGYKFTFHNNTGLTIDFPSPSSPPRGSNDSHSTQYAIANEAEYTQPKYQTPTSTDEPEYETPTSTDEPQYEIPRTDEPQYRNEQPKHQIPHYEYAGPAVVEYASATPTKVSDGGQSMRHYALANQKISDAEKFTSELLAAYQHRKKRLGDIDSSGFEALIPNKKNQSLAGGPPYTKPIGVPPHQEPHVEGKGQYKKRLK